MAFYFESKKTLTLKIDDFDTSEYNKLNLNNLELSIVFFYKERSILPIMEKIFKKLNTEIIGISYCFCNTTEEIKIAEKIKLITDNNDNEQNLLYSDFSQFIIIYNNGKPIKRYSDIISYDKLFHYCLNLQSTIE